MKNWNLKCFLFGHRFVVKDFSGEVENYGTNITTHYYSYIPIKFCVRCGIKNPNYEEIEKIK